MLTGGQRPDGDGYFYPPTVLTGVTADARMVHEEIFGPVAPLTPFDTEDEVVASANATQYGLVSYVFTNDLRRALRVAERARDAAWSGSTRASSPTRPRRSAASRSPGSVARAAAVGIDEFLELKYIGIALAD